MDYGSYQPRRQTYAEAEAAAELEGKRNWHREMAVQKEQSMSCVAFSDRPKRRGLTSRRYVDGVPRRRLLRTERYPIATSIWGEASFPKRVRNSTQSPTRTGILPRRVMGRKESLRCEK